MLQLKHPMSQPEAAQLLNVSRSSVQRARKVRESGTPELVKAVEAGAIKLAAATVLAKAPAKAQAAALANVGHAPSTDCSIVAVPELSCHPRSHPTARDVPGQAGTTAPPAAQKGAEILTKRGCLGHPEIGAFFDTELPHGNAEETIVRLIQRMTRAGFALTAYLNPRQASVVFATPWLAKAVRQEVQRHLALLETRLAEQRDQAISRLRFRVIADADFADEIVQPVLQHVDAVEELEWPAWQPQPSTPLGGAGYGSARRGSARPLTATTKEGGRIGEHVRRTMGPAWPRPGG